VQVGALTSWSQISSSVYSSFAIKTNGTLWSWGDNSQGQLGLGNTISYSSPVQVGALTSWTKLPNGGSTKAGSMGAIQSGKLFTWGYNNRGQLGLNNTTSYSSPVQVGAATTWINFSMPGVSDAIFGLATRS
jgi:alpha-tubulin suppressor-like RCC1 family protein